MALRTLRLGVRSGQRKFSLAIVFEYPQPPVVGVMTGIAALAIGTFVCVFVSVTIDALKVLDIVGFGQVALFTTTDCMLSNQWKCSNVVIEQHISTPIIFVVALGTIRSQ